PGQPFPSEDRRGVRRAHRGGTAPASHRGRRYRRGGGEPGLEGETAPSVVRRSPADGRATRGSGPHRILDRGQLFGPGPPALRSDVRPRDRGNQPTPSPGVIKRPTTRAGDRV